MTLGNMKRAPAAADAPKKAASELQPSHRKSPREMGAGAAGLGAGAATGAGEGLLEGSAMASVLTYISVERIRPFFDKK